MRGALVVLGVAVALAGCAGGGRIPYPDDDTRPAWMPPPQERYPREPRPLRDDGHDYLARGVAAGLPAAA
jgi:hypothetical protein